MLITSSLYYKLNKVSIKMFCVLFNMFDLIILLNLCTEKELDTETQEETQTEVEEEKKSPQETLTSTRGIEREI